MAEKENILEVKNISKTFKAQGRVTRAVDNVSFHLKKERPWQL